MVRFQYVSDLHLELVTNQNKSKWPVIRQEAPILVLAGDIGQVNQSQYKWFLVSCSKRWKHVLVVAGNHEYYQPAKRPKYTVTETQQIINDICQEYPNIVFLQKKSIEIDGVRFLGTTLWSEIKDFYAMRRLMNDYSKIFTEHIFIEDKKRRTDGWVTLVPSTTAEWHREEAAWLRDEIPKSEAPTVVITHHAPHELHLVDPEDRVKQAYVTDMTKLMQKNVVCWVSGHTHKAIAFRPSGTSTLCVSNPRGYIFNLVGGYSCDRVVSVQNGIAVIESESKEEEQEI